MDSQDLLRQFKPAHHFFVGIDSDGCAFDTMEIKQKECFCPNFIRYWGFQPVAKAARQTWEFVNLYSSHRGTNRFLAVAEAFKLLSERKELNDRRFNLPDITPLLEWIGQEKQLGNPALQAYAARVNHPEIDRALAWSKKVNEDIGQMIYGIPPFPMVRESLELLRPHADMMVVSQTPAEALKREWEEHGIDGFVGLIAGQELGTKTEHLKLGAKGKYPENHILMIGDAPGDLKAARANGVLFYPINPGNEEESWEKFHSEGIRRFLDLEYEGEYQDRLISEFLTLLPEKPYWR